MLAKPMDPLPGASRGARLLCRPISGRHVIIRPVGSVLTLFAAAKQCSKRLFEFRQDVEEVADEAIVRDLEDRRFLVLVDGADDLGILHTGQVLDGAGHAHGYIAIRIEDLDGMADLPSVST